MDRADPCLKPNLLVVVSPQPQAALDSIADKAPVLVAMAGTQIKRLKIKYPIQSWYVSLIRDNNGRLMADLENPDGSPPHIHGALSRLYTGLSPEMGMATVIIDANAANGVAVDTIADYSALVGLSQTVQRGVCQPVPTIANLLLKGCDPENQSKSITDVDLAMLTDFITPLNVPSSYTRSSSSRR